jgi:hypothetical protein
MAHRSSTSRPRVALAVLSVLAACGGSRVGNAVPRISTIPAQSTASALTLDLSPYVADREFDQVVYSVLSGGGSFAGSIYQHTLPTMGTYTIEFQVLDSNGGAGTGSFEVDVTEGHFAVVGEDGAGLLLLDTRTDQFVRVAGNASAPAFAAGLGDGKLAFHLGLAENQQLWIFDPFTRTSRRVGDDTMTHVTFRARTSDDHIALTAGTAPDTDLFVFDPRTNLLTEVSATDGELDGDPLVDAQDLVFYERGVAGQADVYFYDPSTDTSTAVGTDPNDEQLLATLPGGGVVFSRVGAGGERDLFWFRRGTGLVEIGTNVPALATADKAFGGAGSNGEVVFTADNGASVDLWFWTPASGLATEIASGGTFAVEAVAPGNEVVYRIENSATEHDLVFFDLDDATTATVRNSTDLGSVLAVTSDGATSWAIVRGSGAPNTASAVSLVAGPATVAFAGASAVALGGVLGNGDVAVETAAGASLGRFDVSAGAWTTIAGTGLQFGGAGVDAGDFVYQQSVSSQTDLQMWDDSLGAPVAVSVTPGDDAFGAATTDGTILFTRVTAGNTNADLFVWHPLDGETQLTDVDAGSLRHDHVVTGLYNGAR